MATATTSGKEGKRAARAAPPPLRANWTRAGCAAALLLFGSVCVALYLWRGWTVWLVVAIPAVALLIILLAVTTYEHILLVLAYLVLQRRGVRCVVIHSQSPIWKDRIQNEWLPRLGPRATTLDWSQRARWRRSIAVALFERFARVDRNFNPAVIVLRGLRQPYVFRFFRAFHEARHGRVSYLQRLEGDLFRTVDASRTVAD
jgi:hypothetical protein